MAELRQRPPTTFGKRSVTGARDYAESSSNLPPSNVLSYQLEGGTRVVIRPSGTEPKLKCYLDHREEMALGEPMAAAESRAASVLAEVRDAVLARLEGT